MWMSKKMKKNDSQLSFINSQEITLNIFFTQTTEQTSKKLRNQHVMSQ